MGTPPKAEDIRKEALSLSVKSSGDIASCGPTGGSLTIEACDLLYALVMPNLPIGRYL